MFVVKEFATSGVSLYLVTRDIWPKIGDREFPVAIAHAGGAPLGYMHAMAPMGPMGALFK